MITFPTRLKSLDQIVWAMRLGAVVNMDATPCKVLGVSLSDGALDWIIKIRREADGVVEECRVFDSDK